MAVKTIPIYDEFVGQTVAKDTVNLVPRVTGFLEKVYFTEGQTVRKGEPLFQIEQASYQASLETAQAKLAEDQASLLKSQRDVARLTPLVQQRAAAQSDLDSSVASVAETEAAIKSDQASINTANLNLSYTTIYSPIDGIIGQLGVTPGNLVSSGQSTVLATISSYNPMYVSFAVPEASYLEVRRKYGNPRNPPPVHLQLILANGQTFDHTGSINFMDRTVDAQTGTLAIRAQFPNPDALLRPGQFTRVRMHLEESPNAVLVPKQAVVQTLNTKSVYIVDANNKVSMKTINTDREYGQYYVVHSGLSGGETVIVEGTQKVRAGMTVKTEQSATTGK